VSNWLPIFTYHRICDVPRAADPLQLCAHPRDFEAVLRYLTTRHCRFVSFDQAVEAVLVKQAPPQKLACLTFDDGYADFYHNALPLLRKYGATATVFMVAGRIGESNRWDDHYGLPPAPLLDAQQIRELAAHGIDFGSHTLTHPRLTSLYSASLQREIVESKRRLEDLLGKPVNSFCYPHIDHDERVRALVRAAGYRSACGGEQAANSRYLIHRINVSQSSWPATLFRIRGWRYALQRSGGLRRLRHALLPEARAPQELVEAQQ
jgi:peptidoglycan/xylan/chitin deacetylase (PgdA/CDA1 family)